MKSCENVSERQDDICVDSNMILKLNLNKEGNCELDLDKGPLTNFC